MIDDIAEPPPVDVVVSDLELLDEEVELVIGEGDLGDVESGSELGLGDAASSQEVEISQELPDADPELFDFGLEFGDEVGDVVGTVVHDKS